MLTIWTYRLKAPVHWLAGPIDIGLHCTRQVQLLAGINRISFLR
jgi:hypothetical protein